MISVRSTSLIVCGTRACTEKAVGRNNTIFGLSAIFRDILRGLLNKEERQSSNEPLQGVQVQECSPSCCEARGEVGRDGMTAA